MTELTRLEGKDFRKLLSSYDIGEYRSHKHIKHALGNTNYVLRTTKAKYIVKIFERSTQKDIRYMLNVEEYLHKNNVKVPMVILSKDRKDIQRIKGKPLAVYEFVKGKHSRRISKELTIDLARNIGRMHIALRKLKLEGKRGWPPANRILNSMYSEYSKQPNQFIERECKRIKKELAQIRYSKLKKSVIHGDLGYINFLVDKNKLKAFLDFDDTHKDFLAHDIAILFAHTFINYRRVKKDRIRLFIKNYQKFVKLNSEEKKALLVFIKVRLISVIIWHEKQKAKHTDQIRHIKRGIARSIKEYRMLDNVSNEEFLRIMDQSG